jgi:protein-tyrosine phosphatase
MAESDFQFTELIHYGKTGMLRRNKRMMKVLFVCHGNICLSPMAEFYMKKLVKQEGLADEFEIASAAATEDEIWNGRGSLMYAPAVKEMRRRGYYCEEMKQKRAAVMTAGDYQKYDLLIGMDQENLMDMKWIAGGDPDNKIHLLLRYAGQDRDVSDPWYTRDFRQAMNDIEVGCQGLLRFCKKEKSLSV